MLIMGVGGWDHDASVALMRDGVPIAVGEEERFTRVRYQGHPYGRSLEFCLRQGKVSSRDVDVTTYYMRRDTVAEFKGYYLSDFVARDKKFVCIDHHAAHAASAFYTSTFNDAAILTIDGYGDGVSAAIWHGRGEEITLLEQVPHPHTLGGLWMGLTQYLGFGMRDEGKTMALASYGEPRYLQFILDRIDLRPDGTYRFKIDNGEVLPFLDGRHTFFRAIEPPRQAGQLLKQVHFDIAASLQEATNTIVMRMAEAAFRLTNSPSLCLAGGVALNSVLNGYLMRKGPFAQVYVPPFPGDNGAGLGSALYYYHSTLGLPRTRQHMSAALGAGFHSDQIEAALEKAGSLRASPSLQNTLLSQPNPLSLGDRAGNTAVPPWRLQHYKSDDAPLEAAELLAGVGVIGWFQGRAEVGPRALGQRSILANPGLNNVRDYLNKVIKRREWFRPYGPAVLQSECGRYFDSCQPSPYMSFVHSVLPSMRKAIPAVTHVDNSARVQTVDADNSPFARLISKFGEHTGIPIILNTSFNNQEPIVNSPDDALRTFATGQLDVLVLGDFVVAKVRSQC